MSSSEKYEEHRCVIEVKVPHFSEGNVHSQCSIEQHVSCHHDAFFNEHFSVEVFANGIRGESDEGYLSIVFNTIKFQYVTFMKNYEFSCVVGALDASGAKRYPKSYIFSSHPQWHTRSEDLYGSFILSRCLQRDVVLGEPDALLPDDCLTLHIEVIFRSWSYESINKLEAFVTDSFGYDAEHVVLNLDSELGEHLIEKSRYFRSMSETPMVEKQRGYTIFRGDEFFFFREVCFILEGVRSIQVPSAEHLRQIYAAADKYDIPVVIESCRGLISTLLQAAENDAGVRRRIEKDVPPLLELAESCNDILLKYIVENFFRRINVHYRNGRGTPDSTRDRSEAEWRLEKVGIDCGYFVFARGTPDDQNFDFYQ